MAYYFVAPPSEALPEESYHVGYCRHCVNRTGSIYLFCKLDGRPVNSDDACPNYIDQFDQPTPARRRAE